MPGNAPKRLINNWRTVMAAPPATPPCRLDGPHGPDCHHAATLAAAPTTHSSCAKCKPRQALVHLHDGVNDGSRRLDVPTQVESVAKWRQQRPLEPQPTAPS